MALRRLVGVWAWSSLLTGAGTQPGKGQGCPLQAPPRAAAHSCRWGLQPLGSEIGGHPADEENLFMRVRIKSPGQPSLCGILNLSYLYL